MQRLLRQMEALESFRLGVEAREQSPSGGVKVAGLASLWGRAQGGGLRVIPKHEDRVVHFPADKARTSK